MDNKKTTSPQKQLQRLEKLTESFQQATGVPYDLQELLESAFRAVLLTQKAQQQDIADLKKRLAALEQSRNQTSAPKSRPPGW